MDISAEDPSRSRPGLDAIGFFRLWRNEMRASTAEVLQGYPNSGLAPWCYGLASRAPTGRRTRFTTSSYRLRPGEPDQPVLGVPSHFKLSVGALTVKACLATRLPVASFAIACMLDAAAMVGLEGEEFPRGLDCSAARASKRGRVLADASALPLPISLAAGPLAARRATIKSASLVPSQHRVFHQQRNEERFFAMKIEGTVAFVTRCEPGKAIVNALFEPGAGTAAREEGERVAAATLNPFKLLTSSPPEIGSEWAQKGASIVNVMSLRPLAAFWGPGRSLASKAAPARSPNSARSGPPLSDRSAPGGRTAEDFCASCRTDRSTSTSRSGWMPEDSRR